MHLTKHHCLGNDFLVLLDAPGVQPVDARLVSAVCDRRRGVGADGLLWVTAGADGVDATMQLYNADGGRAEMSGNGIACLAQAAMLAGWAPLERIVVSTDAGVRVVAGAVGPGARSHRMRVDMGPAQIGDAAPEWVDDDIAEARYVHVGNPHLVLRAAGAGAGARVLLAERGRVINEAVPGGVNVEVVTAGPGPDELTMEVYERGVGITAACGTGACAAAVAAGAWGLTGVRVVVHTKGGASEVSVGDVVHLGTTAVHVADIEYFGDLRGDLRAMSDGERHGAATGAVGGSS